MSPTSGQVQDFSFIRGQIQGGGAAIPSSIGVFIDTNGGANTQVDGIMFTDALVESWGTSGYLITTGQNIQIIGGRSSSNGTAGITLSATGPTNLECIGVDFSATYQNNPAQLQSVVIDVTSGTGDATFYNCPMLGYGAGIAHVRIDSIVAGFILKFFNCPGYNDQKINIVAPSSMPTTVTSAALRGYYGPSQYTPGTGATSYTLNGVMKTITAVNQPITLQPYDTIFQTGSAAGSWVGY